VQDISIFRRSCLRVGWEDSSTAFVWTWELMLGGLAHLGPNLDMIRPIPECRETGKTMLLRGGLLVAFGARHSKALVGAAGLWLLAPHVENHYVLPVCLALVCAPMFALTDIQDGVGRGRPWMGIALLPPNVLRPLPLLVAMAADAAISAT
jgi:O-antigen/teichoic acid export membrane protein